jgi:hypothetical protein
MQSIYTNSGDMPTLVSLTPSHKSGFSAFTGIAASRFNMSSKKGQAAIIGGADVYMSDFGELTIVPNYVQASSNSGTAFILNPDYAGLHTCRATKPSRWRKPATLTKSCVLSKQLWL